MTNLKQATSLIFDNPVTSDSAKTDASRQIDLSRQTANMTNSRQYPEPFLFSVGYLCLAIVLLAICLYLLPIQFRDLWQPDETRYAEISREMLARDNWTVPYLLDFRYFEKPIAGYWLNNIAMWLFGETNFAVRFASVFTTLLTAGLIYYFALQNWHCRKSALLAVLVFLSMFLVLGVGTYSVLDPALMLWLTSAMCSGYMALHAENRKRQFWCFILLGLSCAMAFLTKGFLGLLIPVLVFIPYAMFTRQFDKLFFNSPFILISALMLSLPWALRIAEYETDYWHYFFWVEHIQRFAKDNAQHKAPFWYYFPVLLLAVLPWTGLFIGAIKNAFKREEAFTSRLFLLCWIFIPLLFFSLAKGKLITYILPCMPPIAILITGFITRAHLAKQAEKHPNNISEITAISAISLITYGLPKDRENAVKYNSIINIGFGMTGMILLGILFILAYLQAYQTQLLASLMQYFHLGGLHSLDKIILYSLSEWHKIILGMIAFLSWSIYGAISLSKQKTNWFWAAGSPLLLALFIGFAIPNKINHNKQPESFLNAHKSQLNESAYILTDSVGVATSLGWILKRNDIYLYSAKGELEYGLTYSDSHHRYISKIMLGSWLQEKRREGNIALVLLLQPNQSLPKDLPKPDESFIWHRLAILIYQQSIEEVNFHAEYDYDLKRLNHPHRSNNFNTIANLNTINNLSYQYENIPWLKTGSGRH